MESKQRCIEKLVRDMDSLMPYLQDDDITEIMLNPNNQIWVDKVSQGRVKVGYLDSQRAQSIIYSVAGLIDEVVSTQHPITLPSCLL